MEQEQRQAASCAQHSLGVLIVSEVRFLLESLAETLGRASGIHICGQSATLAQAISAARTLQPAIVLLDVAFPSGTGAAAQLSAAIPESSVVALALVETEENVLAWAEAGVAGYVPNTASVVDLMLLIKQISRGEQTCSSRIAGSLLRRVASSGGRTGSGAPVLTKALLTRREAQILGLVGEGLSNKEIARRLSISLGTTKSHVHNLLGKLSVQRRADVIPRSHAARPYGIEAQISDISIFARSSDR
jgi:two-component system nitrate/nitrite response regulator NarL